MSALALPSLESAAKVLRTASARQVTCGRLVDCPLVPARVQEGVHCVGCVKVLRAVPDLRPDRVVQLLEAQLVRQWELLGAPRLQVLALGAAVRW